MAASRIVEEDINTIVMAIGSEFHHLTDRTLLLTGGTGFLGAYLLETVARLNERVLSKPCRVYVVTREPGRFARRFPHFVVRPEFTLIEGDIKNLRFPSIPWDFVIHAAAPSDARVFVQDPLDTLDTIVAGTRAVLTAAAEAEVEAFLMVSSGAVYGQQPPECTGMSEDYQGAPDLRQSRSAYGEAKRYAELLCNIYREKRGVPVSIARVFSLVGPYQDLNATSAVIDFIRQGSVGDTITIHDDGQAIRSYCYIADAVTALWKLLLCRTAGEVVNVGADLEAISFRALAQRVGTCLGKSMTVRVEGGATTGVLGRRYVPDVDRLYENLGFRATTTLDEALSRTIAWFQERYPREILSRGQVGSAGSGT